MIHLYKHIKEESILSAKITIIDTKFLISTLLVIGKYVRACYKLLLEKQWKFVYLMTTTFEWGID